MLSILEFLAHKLNGGRNPIGYYDAKPTENTGLTPLLQADWCKLVDRLDKGEQIPKAELLYWLQMFSTVELEEA